VQTLEATDVRHYVYYADLHILSSPNAEGDVVAKVVPHTLWVGDDDPSFEAWMESIREGAPHGCTVLAVDKKRLAVCKMVGDWLACKGGSGPAWKLVCQGAAGEEVGSKRRRGGETDPVSRRTRDLNSRYDYTSYF
jgi:hypothetical protein